LNQQSKGATATQTPAAIWEVSPYVVIGFLGFSFYLAWMFTLFSTPAVSPMQLYHSLATNPQADLLNYARFAQLIPLCITLFFGWRLSDFFSSKSGFLLLAIGGISLNTLAFVTLQLPLVHIVLFSIPWVCLGVAQGFTILLWSRFLCTIGEHRILLFAALCVGAASILSLFMSLLQQSAALWATYILSLFSILFFLYVHYKLGGLAHFLLVKAKVSDTRISINWRSAVSVVIYSVGIGFSVNFIAGQNGTIVGILLSSLAVVVAAGIVATDSVRFHRITESILNKLHVPVLILGIAPLFFANLLWQTIASAFMLCFFMVIFIVNLSALSEHVRISRLSPIRVFGYGRAGNALGFLIGTVAYILAFKTGGTEGDINRDLVSVVLLLMLALFVFAASFIFEDHYPSKEVLEGGEPPVKQPPAHGLPVSDFKSLSLYDKPSGDPQEERTGTWKKRCTKVASNYGLSPKETEVLLLLAKGRNAEYIQENLVVSRHTAKAHIYHIYQKTNIHSRQELIDLLEDVDVD
jgi:DNA-binding CsgD family transcriptional regulator